MIHVNREWIFGSKCCILQMIMYQYLSEFCELEGNLCEYFYFESSVETLMIFEKFFRGINARQSCAWNKGKAKYVTKI